MKIVKYSCYIVYIIQSRIFIVFYIQITQPMMIHYTTCSSHIAGYYIIIIIIIIILHTRTNYRYRERKDERKKIKAIKNLDRHTTMWNAARHPVYNDRNRVWTDCSEYNNSNNNTIK